ncbi:MAG: formimidoylglutamase [Flavobacteriaceae bacterium]|jgi:arginase family enzyme|nr:formimidoylglutamase [Flavobacteriaceae bacterium]MDG1794257.1 formimidoylglutamase [Flavobacteriaceae bacterium]
MDFSFLTPVQDRLVEQLELQHSQVIGQSLRIHTATVEPDLKGVKMAIVGVLESRNSVDYIGQDFQLSEIRKAFYKLFPGNWTHNIADLGDIQKGETVEDTYFALIQVLSNLIKDNIIPIIIGGSQDLTYANYRAYDKISSMINIVNVDKSFDLGDSSKPITNESYLGKIILEQPYNLFNYTALGFQTYFNSQEEIDLMEKLYFESFRLGSIIPNISVVEPVLRDADLVTLDINSVKSSEVSPKQKYSPNGFTGREICAISRYAGISNKVSSFGVYEYNPSMDDEATAMLVAQVLWYFIEGVNCRVKDDDFKDLNSYLKFTVLVESEELVFFKSKKTERWWIEIPFLEYSNTKSKQHPLLACTYEDYVSATSGIIPERWYKAYKKN